MEEAATVYWEQLDFERRFKESQQSGADRINRHEADEASTCTSAEMLRELTNCQTGLSGVEKENFLGPKEDF